MKILLILPAGEQVRVTKDRPEAPSRAMLRFRVLPLTMVAALTPPEHQVRSSIEIADDPTLPGWMRAAGLWLVHRASKP
jgi:hypothetical protein